VGKSALWTFPRSGFFHSSVTHRLCCRARKRSNTNVASFCHRLNASMRLHQLPSRSTHWMTLRLIASITTPFAPTLTTSAAHLASWPEMGAVRRFLLNGGQFGFPLSECSDHSIAFYLTCAMQDALTGQFRIDRLSELIGEGKQRGLGSDELAAALRKRSELHNTILSTLPRT
jgi:hypothetical protein